MNKILAIIGLILFLYATAEGQDYQYKLSVKGKETGLLNVWEEQDSKRKKIRVETEVDANLLFLNMEVKYSVESIYENGILQKSKARTFVNGKKKKAVNIRYRNGRYRINKDREVSYHDDPIHYSGAMLYIEEPRNTDQVFSEMDAVYKPIHVNGPHQYELDEPNGNRQNEYHYHNGILRKAVIDHSLMNFTVERK